MCEVTTNEFVSNYFNPVTMTTGCDPLTHSHKGIFTQRDNVVEYPTPDCRVYCIIIYIPTVLTQAPQHFGTQAVHSQRL
jgi:hypothetical protein